MDGIMIDFLLTIFCGVIFFLLWWRIGLFLMRKFGDGGLGDELIIFLWPPAVIFGVVFAYYMGKLIIMLIEKVLLN